jgi:predicted phosphohydrolase
MQFSKIQYASDLHLEFPQNKAFLNANPLVPTGDVLLLAGDIVPFAVMDKHKDFFSYIADNFQTTYWVPGNHEYYYFDAATKTGELFEKIRSNIFLVNNTVVKLQNSNLIFSTLWSKINPANQWQIERGVSDFQVIKYNGFRFSADKFNQLHNSSMVFITEQLQLLNNSTTTEQHRNNSNKTIVVSHHVPTLLNYPALYKGNDINQAFAVELFDFIEASTIDYWIYGHHHYNTPTFTIGNTQMLTNQLGYIQRNENQFFSNNKCI